MNDKRTMATYVLAASLFCLAAALVYFTIELTRVVNQIPIILTTIEHTSEKIEPVIKEISEIREQIPPIIDEVRQVREQIPPILEEVRQVRELVPPILEETRQIRILVPDVLDEVAKAREAIPPMLEKGERMIGEAKKTGQKASEGAVTGVITGIFKAPFKIVGNMGKSLFGSLDTKQAGITDEDLEVATTTATEVLSSGEVGETREWSNPKSGNQGKFTLKSLKTIDGRECRVAQSIVIVEGVEEINKELTACKNDDSEWEMLE